MSSREQLEAERRIANALFVLNCIVPNPQELKALGGAIDAYVAGDFRKAITLAVLVAKAGLPKVSAIDSDPPRSLIDLQRLFGEARERPRASNPAVFRRPPR